LPELKPFDQTEQIEERKKERFLERERKEGRKEGPTVRIMISYRVPRIVRDNFQLVAKLRGFRRYEDAMAEALQDWIERNRPPSVQIINMAPVSIIVTKIGKLEARIAVEDLTAALNLVANTPPEAEGYPEFARKLLDQLRKATAIVQRTRDPELSNLIAQVEAQIQ
jgi:hypothetical protein